MRLPWSKPSNPGPDREVEMQIGWLHCGLCHQNVPLIIAEAYSFEAADGTTHIGIRPDMADAELHMLTAHGMLAD
jgi:hypothetical protein